MSSDDYLPKLPCPDFPWFLSSHLRKARALRVFAASAPLTDVWRQGLCSVHRLGACAPLLCSRLMRADAQRTRASTRSASINRGDALEFVPRKGDNQLTHVSGGNRRHARFKELQPDLHLARIDEHRSRSVLPGGRCHARFKQLQLELHLTRPSKSTGHHCDYISAANQRGGKGDLVLLCSGWETTEGR